MVHVKINVVRRGQPGNAIFLFCAFARRWPVAMCPSQEGTRNKNLHKYLTFVRETLGRKWVVSSRQKAKDLRDKTLQN